METLDVLIIGAGAAGLAASRQLSPIGCTVAVLEARSRIGGRAWTEQVEGYSIDRGAQWLHASQVNPLTSFAKYAGVALSKDSHEAAVIYDEGQPAPGAVSAYRRASQKLGRSTWWGAMFGRRTLADVAGKDFWTHTTARAIAELEMGAALEGVSLNDIMRTERGDDLAVAGGLGTLVGTFGEGAPVRLTHAVESVTWSDRSRILVRGPFGAIATRRLLVTAPTGVLQSGSIAFDPPLPNWKSEAIQALPMGLLTKFSFLLPRPVELGSFAIDLEATRSGHLHLAHLDGSKTSMTIIMGGPTARGLMATSTETAIAFGRTIVAALVDEETARKARATVSDWDGDPYARGAYAVVNPRNSGARRLYDRAIDDRIFFAGEASDSRQPGTVGGAVLAGARAAQQIANSLKADIRSSLRQQTAFG